LVIQQLHYATTPRYNFPHTLQELELPRKLIELSLSSMRNAQGRRFQPCQTDFPETLVERPHLIEPARLNNKTFSTLLTPLKATRDGTPIVAIDVSSIRIGETDTGIIYAIRGAIVWNEKRRYRYLRIGPFPFHITEENQRGLSDFLSQEPLATRSITSSLTYDAQSQLCNLAERWMQMAIACSTNDSIVLWDGSLTAGTPGNPTSVLSQIVTAARGNSNSVLAFTKVTSIRFLGWKITDLILRQRQPCLLEVEDLPLSISKNVHLLGRIFVAKLATDGCSFRLDIDRTLTREQSIIAVERLLGNELLFQGYPESLRLAHIYSTFTASDVIGVQSFITREYGLRVVTRTSMRRRLFGPFGTGFED